MQDSTKGGDVAVLFSSRTSHWEPGVARLAKLGDGLASPTIGVIGRSKQDVYDKEGVYSS
jgi:hypothetical protein